MTPEQLQAALDAALGPLVARLDRLEAPAPPAPAPVEASDASAEIRAMFDGAVTSAFDRYAALGKVTLAAREHFLAACTTPATFRAICAMYDSAPAVVATEPVTQAAVKPDPSSRFSAETHAWAKKSGIDMKKLFAEEGAK